MAQTGDKELVQLMVGASAVLATLIIGYLVYLDWLIVPSVLYSPLTWSVVIVVLVLGALGYHAHKNDYLDRVDYSSFNRDTSNQLNQRQAEKLVRYDLLYSEYIEVGEWIDKGIEYIQQGEDGDSDDAKTPAVRLFKLDFKTKRRGTRICIFVNLDQDVETSIDWNDQESIKQALRSLSDRRLIRETRSSDFEEDVKEKKKQLAESVLQPSLPLQYNANGELVPQNHVPQLGYQRKQGQPQNQGNRGNTQTQKN